MSSVSLQVKEAQTRLEAAEKRCAQRDSHSEIHRPPPRPEATVTPGSMKTGFFKRTPDYESASDEYDRAGARRNVPCRAHSATSDAAQNGAGVSQSH